MKGYCDECDHRLVLHGDRAIGGACSAGEYPKVCGCSGFIVTSS